MTLHLNNLCHSLDLGNSLFKSSYITERSSYLVKPGTHLRLLPKPATNHEQSRLSPIPSTLPPIIDFAADTVDFVAGFGDRSATT